MQKMQRFGLLFLVGCTTTNLPEFCSTLDAAGVASGGTVTAGCYTLDEDLTITGDLVFEEGVTIDVAPGVAIVVESGGSLDARGTAEKGVSISGLAADSWAGLHFENALSPNNKLVHTVIQGACSRTWNGNDRSYGAIFADEGTRLVLEDLTVRDCSKTGLHLFDTTVVASVDGYQTNAGTPMRLGVQQAASLTGDLIMTGSDTTIHINDGVVDSPTTLPAYAYTIDVDLEVTHDLVIEAGATLSFDQNIGLDVFDQGSLNAVGQPDQRIVLQGARQDTTGYWKGVHLENSTSIDNQLDHLSILNAGSDFWHGGDDSRAGIYLEGDQVRLQLSNCRIAAAGGPAFLVDGGGLVDTVDVSTCIFEDSDAAAHVTPSGVQILGADVQFLNNMDNRVRIYEGMVGADAIESDVVWVARAVPYFIDDTVYVLGSLDIEPGSTLLFGNNVGLAVGDWPTDGGTLTIGETGGAQVLMAGEAGVAGSWRGLYFNETLGANHIRNARIENAGSSGWNGAATSQAALYLNLEATLELTDVVFDANEYADVYVGDDSTLTGCTGVVGSVDGSPSSSFCSP